MGEQYRDIGVGSFDEKCRDPTPRLGVEPEVTGGVEVGGGRRLKEKRANHVSHYYWGGEEMPLCYAYTELLRFFTFSSHFTSHVALLLSF